MTLYAAWKMDTEGPRPPGGDRMIKYYGRCLYNVIDRHPVHGPGFSTDLPSSPCTGTPAARIYDGPDESTG